MLQTCPSPQGWVWGQGEDWGAAALPIPCPHCLLRRACFCPREKSLNFDFSLPWLCQFSPRIFTPCFICCKICFFPFFFLFCLGQSCSFSRFCLHIRVPADRRWPCSPALCPSHITSGMRRDLAKSLPLLWALVKVARAEFGHCSAAESPRAACVRSSPWEGTPGSKMQQDCGLTARREHERPGWEKTGSGTAQLNSALCHSSATARKSLQCPFPRSEIRSWVCHEGEGDILWAG